jgi:hypothetical protein
MGYSQLVKRLAVETEISKRVKVLQAKDATLSQVDAEAEVLRYPALYQRYREISSIQSSGSSDG